MGVAVRLCVELDRPGPHRAGGAVAGRVLVLVGGAARSLEVSLVRTERSPDFAADREVTRVTVAEGALEAGSAHSFTVALPSDAAPTVASAHGGLGWEIRARADRRGRDAHGSHAVLVGPADTV